MQWIASVSLCMTTFHLESCATRSLPWSTSSFFLRQDTVMDTAIIAALKQRHRYHCLQSVVGCDARAKSPRSTKPTDVLSCANFVICLE